MKMKICLALVAVTLLSGLVPVNAQGISINIGDRPYYNRGPSYVEGTRHYVWIPGHYTRRHAWIHGHYGLRR